MERREVIFYLNGVKQRVSGDDCFLMLADWLRRRALKPGTKIVCAEGDCGACTVMVASLQDIDAEAKRATRSQTHSFERSPFKTINSCIRMVAQLDQHVIVTVEGLEREGQPTSLQRAMATANASQCGYCTPGFVMALSCLQESHSKPTKREVMNALTGNLCRCTGYEPIIQAGMMADPSPKESLATRYITKAVVSDLKKLAKDDVLIQRSSVEGPKVKGPPSHHKMVMYLPSSLKAALAFARKHSSNVQIIAGTSDLGVQCNKGRELSTMILGLGRLLDKSVTDVSRVKSQMNIGCNVTLEQLRKSLFDAEFPELKRLLNIFASPQIKNVATLTGNIANASPIGDTMPLLMTLQATLYLSRLSNGRLINRSVPLSQFYKGYKKTDLKPGEIITRVTIPIPYKNTFVKAYKVSQRKDLDISAVNVALSCQWERDKDNRISVFEGRLAIGGVAATPLCLDRVFEKSLKSSGFIDDELLSGLVGEVTQTIKPLSDLRGSSDYRRVLVENLIRRFFTELRQSHGEDLS